MPCIKSTVSTVELTRTRASDDFESDRLFENTPTARVQRFVRRVSWLSGHTLYDHHQDNETPKQQARAAHDKTPHHLTRATDFAVRPPNNFASFYCLDDCDE